MASAASADGNADAASIAIPATVAAPAPAAPAGPILPAAKTITVVTPEGEAEFATTAATVDAVLNERGIHPHSGDFVSSELDAALADGMRVEYRPSVAVAIVYNKHRKTLRSSAANVGAMLADARYAVGPHDLVFPSRRDTLKSGETVRVVRVDRWYEHKRKTLATEVLHRNDATLAAGTQRTVQTGFGEIRDTLVLVERRDGGRAARTDLDTRVVRAARPEIVAQGTHVDRSIVHSVATGISSAMHLAGNALHMIATAYTASCYGCSGITATGVRAGFGIIAVDPHVIPLGTKLFVPGYGRAVAGDTGGAIVGNRVDLGMNTVSQALRFGRRPVTVYVLR